MNIRLLAIILGGLTTAGGIIGALIGGAMQLSSTTYSHPTIVALLIGLAVGLGFGVIIGPLAALD